MRIKTIALILALLSQSFIVKSQNDITKEELKKHISYLASDELKGRKPGTKGSIEAANYIANELKDSGLKLQLGKGFQYFDVISGLELGKENTLNFNNKSFSVKKDFIPLNFSKNGTYESEIVFAGYGFNINQTDFKHNDYQNINVKGKWVLVLNGDPEPKDRNSKFIPFSNQRSKTLTAKDQGAIGIIFVTGKLMGEKEKLIELSSARGLSKANLPALEITRELANQLFDNKTVDDLELYLDQKIGFIESNFKVSASLEVNLLKTKTQNVIAFIQGNDPKYKHEIIVIGGHYDHLGMGGFGSGSRTPDTSAVHNGADDNASGIAGLIEIAEKLKANRKDLKRSIAIVAFGAEEMGLLGSKYFVDNPIFKLEHVKAMINLDMIGRLDSNSRKVSIGGTGTSTESEDLLTKLEKKTDLKLSFSKEGFGPSDHASFYINNIPVFFISSGAHSDYHTPNDDIEYINFEGLQAISNLSYDLALDLATRKEALHFQEAGPKEAGSARRGLKVTLGIMPAFGESEVKGLGVDAVTPNRPAEKGGMKKGDIIVAINGKEVTNIYDYMNRLQTLKAGETINVDVIRDNIRLVLLIQL